MFVQDDANPAKSPANRADRLPRIVEALASWQIENTTGKRESESNEERPNFAYDRLRFVSSRSSEKVGTGEVQRIELQSNPTTRSECACHLSKVRWRIHEGEGHAAGNAVYRSVSEPRHIFGLALDESCVWVANLRSFQRSSINVDAVAGDFPWSRYLRPHGVISASYVENTGYHVVAFI